MRAISENLLNKIQSDTRAYDIMLTVYHRYIDADGNISFDTSTDYSSNAELLGVSGLQGATTGYLQLGKTFVSELDFSLTKNAVCRVGDKVKLWLDFGNNDTITLATAYVDTVSHDQWQSNFTAYDKMMQLNKAYTSNLTYPASTSAVVDEICEQTGLELEPFVFECNPTFAVAPVSPNTDYNGNSVYYSYREILGYIALANASNVVIDEETERLKFVKYTDSGSVFDYNKTIRRTINNENYVINAIKISDTGYSEGNAKGEYEVFFPLHITQPKEYIYSYLSTHFVGLSYIGMTAQKQGYGIYQIGDLINYADFDGEIYTFAVMGVKYDFSGGYFTEQLYSLAPSEMEAEYSGSIYVGQSNTNIKNPVIISEKSKSYLKYDYTSIGYIKGDEASYGSEENTVINNGYLMLSSSQAINENCVYKRMSFPVGYNLSTGAPISGDKSKITDLSVFCYLADVNYTGGKTIEVFIEFNDKDGASVLYRIADFYVVSGADWGIYAEWEKIFAPTQDKPYGYADIYFRAVSFEDGEWEREYMTYGWNVEIPFANINEYNMAVQLTSVPLEVFDVVQNVMQIVEGDNYADLPEIGTADTLYVTYQPPAVYKYSTVTQSYYCVGRNYKEIQRIVSTTKPDDNEVATYKVPVVFDVRTKAEWELESNTVFPKGFVILEQEPETREKTRIKIANGIDKLSDLAYNGIDETALDEKADKSDLQAHIDDKANPHEVTKEQIGLGSVENKSSAEILSELEIGGRNLLFKSKFNKRYNSGWAYSTSVSCVFENGYAILTKEPTARRVFAATQASYNSSSAGAGNPLLLPEEGSSYTTSIEVMKIADVDIGNETEVFSRYVYTDGTYLDNIITIPSDISEEKWTRLSLSWVYRQSKPIDYVQYNIALGAPACGLKIRNLKLEIGNKPTDWTPAPEDAEIRITSLEERVAALEAAILSLGGET